MSDEPNSDPQTVAIACRDLDHSITKYRDYSESDRYSALAAFDLYGGNYHRTSIAYSVPVSTLRAWVKARAARGEGPSNLERERRGSLAAKLESKVHDVVESITPEIIKKASLSQRGVFIGILTDKLRTMRGDELELNPAVELARLLGCSVEELPPTLQPEPGGEIPERPILETRPDSDGAYAVENPSPDEDVNATEENRKLVHAGESSREVG